MPIPDLLPGVPHVESPLIQMILRELDLTEMERKVAIDLHHCGYSVIDFPDPQLEVRIERIKANLASRFDANLGAYIPS